LADTSGSCGSNLDQHPELGALLVCAENYLPHRRFAQALTHAPGETLPREIEKVREAVPSAGS
jgi:hypothetical protein